MIFKVLLLGSVLLLSTGATNPESLPTNPIVTTRLGNVKGSIMESTPHGRPIYAFRGIRYAKAPVDELRFQPPVPVEKWNDTYDATKDGPACPQPEIRPISEDCLFLNVYTTKLPRGNHLVKRPVIVFIHPGGFYGFTGSSAWIGPQYFAHHDVVLVSINYRLGSLGFLSTGDHLAPGNNGLKDQVVALKWIQRNIAAFGGDPNLVTITGYSAGSLSGTLHLVSPMSRGLFHRLIAMSSSGFAQWSAPHHQLHLAKKQAQLVGCPDNSSSEIIECLKTKSAEELGNSMPGFTEFGVDPILIWQPVVENDFGQERFLVECPIQSVLSGRFVNVPVMTGITKDEFGRLSIDVMSNSTLVDEMDKNFETVAPISFLYERNTERSKHISQELRKSFLGEGPITNSSITGLADLYADSVVGFGVDRTAKLMALKSRRPVYYYKFTYQGRYGFFTLPGTNIPYGVSHHDDLLYLFYVSTLFPFFNETFPEYQTMKKLTQLHVNFALTGNPTPHRTHLLDHVKWEPFTLRGSDYLDIGEKLVVRKKLYDDRYRVWERLFPLDTEKKCGDQ